MNHQPPSDRDSNLDKAIDRVVREFEIRWHEDNHLVIEDFLGSIESLVQPCGVDLWQQENVDAILAELVHVERDLKGPTGDQFQKEEFLARVIELRAAFRTILQGRQPGPGKKNVIVTRSQIGDESGSGDTTWVIEDEGHTEIPIELGPYQQITWIGAGGFGIVCRAIDSRNRDTVALKFPKQRGGSATEATEILKEEARLAMQLDHPAIVTTLAIENIDSYVFVVQEFIDGASLHHLMRRRRLSQHEVAKLIAVVADALAYAHRNGIYHRDIKPANILIDRYGRPFIADFGLAIHASRRYETIGRPICGTKMYFSPEVVVGRTYQMGGANDIWSLGISMYELLIGKRPFAGPSSEILFAEIRQQDPEPLHVLDPNIDPELERICLSCLEKKPGRRLTGRKVSDALGDWLKRPTKGFEPDDGKPFAPPIFVPRGLHSYTAKDAPFFLRLLPGPLDEHGIPASIRFWQQRILEPVPYEDRVPVGVIYGPSGSGKSSFVKAGLIPQLKDQVTTIYVESTYADTDVRLLRALEAKFPEIPAEQSSLPEILEGLAAGKWRTDRNKVLIVLDQFEQRLNAMNQYDPTELINALQNCDGEILQCLLLVRDDFWLSLSRFADELQMDLRQGQNTQLIDLFDRQHAQKILTMLGYAYQRLSTDDFKNLSKDETAFIEKAVDEYLLQDQHVICVRLTVFAEMLKSNPWKVSKLKEFGSVAGVGQSFLETTFSAKEYRGKKKAVQCVFGDLLPKNGTDIRGSMRSFQQLRNAAKNETSIESFPRLLHSLEGGIGLLMRTGPDWDGIQTIQNASNGSNQEYYQLTHDYLVPSIRDWLVADLEKTWTGRRNIRFENLVRRYTGKRDREILPTLPEYVSLLFAISRSVRVQSNPFWKDASTKAIWHFLALLLFLVTTIGFGTFGYSSYHNRRAKELYEAALNCEPGAFEIAVERLFPYRRWVASHSESSHLVQNTRQSLHRHLILIKSGFQRQRPLRI